MPRRAIDDRVPAHTLDDRTVETRNLHLIEHVTEPVSLVKSGMPSMIDRMAVVPARLRHHYGLAVARHVRSSTFASGVRAVCG